MKRSTKNFASGPFPQRRNARSQNLLDLSAPPTRLMTSKLYWTVLFAMIAAYGGYMGSIAWKDRQTDNMKPEGGETADAIAVAVNNGPEPLAKADREPIKMSVNETAPARPNNRPLQNAALNRQVQSDPEIPHIPLKNTEPATRKPESASQKPALFTYTMKSHSGLSSAEHAILKQDGKAGGQWQGLSDTAESYDETEIEEKTIMTAQLTRLPLPQRRPHVSAERARYKPNIQSKTPQKRQYQKQALLRKEILSYRANVRAHLAARKPQGGFGSGRVAVAFRLSEAGEVLSAKVIRAPRSSDLNDRALEAIYQAEPFPRAPAGALRSHRYFIITYLFE